MTGAKRVKNKSESTTKFYQIDFDKEDLCNDFLSAVKNENSNVFAPCSIKRNIFKKRLVYTLGETNFWNLLSQVDNYFYIESIYLRFIEIYRTCIELNLPIEKIIFDFNYLSVENSLSDYKVIYVPLNSFKKQDNINTFLYNVINCADKKALPYELREKYIVFFNSNPFDKPYFIDVFEKLISEIHREAEAYYGDTETEILQPSADDKFNESETTILDNENTEDISSEKTNDEDISDKTNKHETESKVSLNDAPTELLDSSKGVEINSNSNETVILGSESQLEETVPLSKSNFSEEKSNNPYIRQFTTNKKFNAAKFPLFIGTNSNADFVISNPAVSGMHAKIDLADGAYYFEDLDSLNFSYVEGVRALPGEKYPLYKGSRFILANEEFQFEI